MEITKMHSSSLYALFLYPNRWTVCRWDQGPVHAQILYMKTGPVQEQTWSTYPFCVCGDVWVGGCMYGWVGGWLCVCVGVWVGWYGWYTTPHYLPEPKSMLQSQATHHTDELLCLKSAILFEAIFNCANFWRFLRQEAWGAMANPVSSAYLMVHFSLKHFT